MSIVQQLKNKRVLIVGDLMIDRYWHGSVSRISPEAPVPVVRFLSAEDRLGGAGNVALNVAALGAEPILCSVVGATDERAAWRFLFEKNGLKTDGLLESDARRSTVKTRILGNQQQMLRLDSEDTFDLNEAETDLFLKKIRQNFEKTGADVVILQDYNKGVLTERVIETVLAEAQRRGIPTAVDPKKNHFFSYKNVSLFKPNLKEVRDATGLEIVPTTESLQRAAVFLREKLSHDSTMITLSEHGIYTENGGVGSIWPTSPRSIADVSGAGDTVVAVAALGLAAGFSLETIARLSNLAGGQVCEQAGVVPVSLERLIFEADRAFAP